MKKLAEYVDMRFGVTPHTLCSIGPKRPNSSVLPSPDTFPPSYSGYAPGAPVRGFSQIHVHAGEPNYGHFLLSPQIGLSTKLDSHDSEIENEAPGAAEYIVTLKKWGIDVAFTPTAHCVFYKFTYPRSGEALASIVLDIANCYNLGGSQAKRTCVKIDTDSDGNTVISGSAVYETRDDYTINFYALVDKKAFKTGTYLGDEVSEGVNFFSDREITDDIWCCRNGVPTVNVGTGCYMQFETEERETVKLKMGVSFHSIERAKEYLEREIPDWNYDRVKEETVDVWEKMLSKIKLSENTPEEKKALFYTAFYNCFAMPRDRTGEFESKYGTGDMTDDHIATWDTFRTLYPLYDLINRDFVAKTMNSYITRGKKNGYIRDLFNAGTERARNQGGDNTDNVIADAILKDVPGFDREKAYELMKFNADHLRDDLSVWGPKLSELASGSRTSAYITRGYLAADMETEWVMGCSKTLEYAYNDYLAGKVAEKLSNDTSISSEKRASYASDAKKYLERSNNWKNLWNPDAEAAGFKGFIMPRDADGKWHDLGSGKTPYDQKFEGPLTHCLSWNNYYYEGTAFEYSFFVPHDVKTLIEYMGGDEKFCERLEFGMRNDNIIWPGNQPGLLPPYLACETSEPWHTTDLVEYHLDKFSFETGTGMGNDDSGCMSSWYVFSVIGIFPSAGQTKYYLTSPKFDEVTIDLGEGKSFCIRAKNLSDENRYIQSVTLNGVPHKSTTIDHGDIMRGGELVFEMGSERVNYAE